MPSRCTTRVSRIVVAGRVSITQRPLAGVTTSTLRRLAGAQGLLVDDQLERRRRGIADVGRGAVGDPHRRLRVHDVAGARAFADRSLVQFTA